MSVLTVLTALTGTAFADEPREAPGEVIRIRDPQPAKPISDLRTPLPYSDDAILGDAWEKAWLLLEIDVTGTVTRLSVLVRPGHSLEPIAVREAWKLKFEPARDAGGAPMRSHLLWGIEWPSIGWLQAFNYPATARLPWNAVNVPCKGSAPMKMWSPYPTLRDCRPPPPLAKLGRIQWQERPR